MTLIVFAGTFNPIHTAHLIMAEFAREELNAEKILFIPSFNPPHKDNDLAEVSHRFNMVKSAVKDNPFFEVSDIEIKLGGISYTYNTISELYRQNPYIKDRIRFITGADALGKIKTWYKPDELAKMIEFVVISRPGSKNLQDITDSIDLKDFNCRLVEAPEMDISSSAIRQRIKEKKSIKYLVPYAVEKYIQENRLYSSEKS